MENTTEKTVTVKKEKKVRTQKPVVRKNFKLVVNKTEFEIFTKNEFVESINFSGIGFSFGKTYVKTHKIIDKIILIDECNKLKDEFFNIIKEYIKHE